MITFQAAQRAYIRAKQENDFCPDALKWTRRRPSLKAAWERCTNVGWMFWWLSQYCAVPYTALNAIDGFVIYTSYEDRRTADRIRAKYTYWGKEKRA